MHVLIFAASSGTQRPVQSVATEGLPAYDALSIAPPSIGESSSSRQHESNTYDDLPQQHKKSLKEKWREAKEEDARRKEQRVQYVTPEEADRITGLERRREEEAKNGGRHRSGFGALVVIAGLP